MRALPPALTAPMEIIRSRQNPLVKQLIKLADNRRERLKQRRTLLLGTHLLESALAAGWPLEQILVCEGEEQRPEIARLLTHVTIPVLMMVRELFAEVEQQPSTTGIMALTLLPDTPAPRRDGCCLLLEGVQDPGNVGSILRTAAAAGVDQIWLSTGCADAWSPRVLRAGMGAHFLLPVIERIDIHMVLPDFAGSIVVTALEQSRSVYESDLRGDLVLALGSEGGGVSPILLGYATETISIPMRRDIESLNVGAAAAICLFERVRQLTA